MNSLVRKERIIRYHRGNWKGPENNATLRMTRGWGMSFKGQLLFTSSRIAGIRSTQGSTRTDATGKAAGRGTSSRESGPGLLRVIPHGIHHIRRALTFIFEVLGSNDYTPFYIHQMSA